MIFKGVLDGKPYPDHGLSHRQWAQIPPRQIRLDELVTTTTVLRWTACCRRTRRSTATCSRMPCRWRGVIYLEDGLHRAVRAALRNRTVLHARVFDMDMPLPAHRLTRVAAFVTLAAAAARLDHRDPPRPRTT